MSMTLAKFLLALEEHLLLRKSIFQGFETLPGDEVLTHHQCNMLIVLAWTRFQSI